MPLKELGEFDLLINLIPVNHQRSKHKSMKDLCLEIMKLNGKNNETFLPSIVPDNDRVSRFQPMLEQIKEKTGKKLLCVNWKSRFPHKDAPPLLFFENLTKIAGEFQAVLFKDVPTSKIMQEEIENLNLPVNNLSHLVHDYHDTVAALSLIDAFISVDTGIVHAAGAMGIPGVALFGPFPPATHISDYSSVIGVRAQYKGGTCNGPCLETHRGCAEIGFSPERISPCFEAISADSVVNAFEKAVNLPKTMEHDLPGFAP